MTRLARLPWARVPKRGGGHKNWETSEVMEPIRQACRRLHLRCERNATGLGRGFKSADVLRLHTAGTWDLTVYLPRSSCVVMVECKMPGESLDLEQASWGIVYQQCGLERIVATSVEQFLAELSEIMERRAVARQENLGHPKKRSDDGPTE